MVGVVPPQGLANRAEVAGGEFRYEATQVVVHPCQAGSPSGAYGFASSSQDAKAVPQARFERARSRCSGRGAAPRSRAWRARPARATALRAPARSGRARRPCCPSQLVIHEVADAPGVVARRGGALGDAALHRCGEARVEDVVHAPPVVVAAGQLRHLALDVDQRRVGDLVRRSCSTEWDQFPMVFMPQDRMRASVESRHRSSHPLPYLSSRFAV